MSQSFPGSYTQPQEKKPRGCFFYGCLTIIILIVVGSIAGYIAVKRFINTTVETFTDTSPISLPDVDTTGVNADQVQANTSKFIESLKSGSPAGELVLSGRDINALIKTHPELAKLKGKISLDIQGDRIWGAVSAPLDEFGFPGRYFNGSASFKISLEDNRLTIFLDSLSNKGQEVPEEIMSQLRAKNLAEEFLKEPENKKLIESFQSIRIENGLLKIVAKR